MLATLLRDQDHPIKILDLGCLRDELSPPAYEALLSLEGRERLETYPFYAAALGEIELRLGNTAAAHEHYRTAIALARSPMERRFLQARAVRSLPADA